MAEGKEKAAQEAAKKGRYKPRHKVTRQKISIDPKWVIIGIAIALVIAIMIPLYGSWLENKPNSGAAVEAAIIPIQEDDPSPVVPAGTSVWRVQANKMAAEPAYADFMTRQNGVTLEMANAFATLEEQGINLQKVIPAGTWVVNSGSSGDNGWYAVQQPLKEDRLALTDTDGEPKVLVSCGNPMRLTSAPRASTPTYIPPATPPETPPATPPETPPTTPPEQPPVVTPPPPVVTPGPVPCPTDDDEEAPDTGIDPDPSPAQPPPGVVVPPPGPNETGPGADPPG